MHRRHLESLSDGPDLHLPVLRVKLALNRPEPASSLVHAVRCADLAEWQTRKRLSYPPGESV